MNAPLETRLIPGWIADGAAQTAAKYGVSGIINAHDLIWWYIFDNQKLDEKPKAIEDYFESGHQTAVFLKNTLIEPGVGSILAERQNPGEPVSILDFASGYGRVTRHFPTVLPDARVVASDIHPEAIRFLGSIGCAACISSSVPEQFQTPQKFDVVFALSFFTHMPRSSWSRWLHALSDKLVPGGLLIFTAHGRVSQRLMGVSELEPDGFYFTPSSEQTDLPTAEYGGTVTTFDFVFSQLAGGEVRLVQYRQAGVGHHDVYVLWKARDGVGHAGTGQARLQGSAEAVRPSRSRRLIAQIRRILRGG